MFEFPLPGEYGVAPVCERRGVKDMVHTAAAVVQGGTGYRGEDVLHISSAL